MNKYVVFLLIIAILCIGSGKLFSQRNLTMQEFGVNAGALTNFPANQNYLNENIKVFYAAPYLRTGQHEFSAGIVYPLQTHALYNNESNIDPRPGATAGYKFYVFDVYGRENLFVHYSFQYLRFAGSYNIHNIATGQTFRLKEMDTYINNVIGLGYNLFFDMNGRFGFFYTLDYIISQTSYKAGNPGSANTPWITSYAWEHISTNFGFIFKLTALNSKAKK